MGIFQSAYMTLTATPQKNQRRLRKVPIKSKHDSPAINTQRYYNIASKLWYNVAATNICRLPEKFACNKVVNNVTLLRCDNISSTT